MKIKIGPSERTLIKEKNRIAAELWTKLKTIRDDENTPLVYTKWCSQVMEYLELLPNDK